MTRTLCLLCLLMISCKGEQHADTPAKPLGAVSSDCNSQRQTAIADFNSKTAKYYFHGIAYPSKEVVEKLQAANVTVVVNGCLPEKDALCYNYFVDSLLQTK